MSVYLLRRRGRHDKAAHNTCVVVAPTEAHARVLACTTLQSDDWGSDGYVSCQRLDTETRAVHRMS